MTVLRRYSLWWTEVVKNVKISLNVLKLFKTTTTPSASSSPSYFSLHLFKIEKEVLIPHFLTVLIFFYSLF